MEFDLVNYNFGKIKPGQKAIYDFKFKNSGKDTLVIEKVKSSCGCTAAMPSKKSFAPGEEGDIHVAFNSTGYDGAVSKTISVYSNDPEKPEMGLKIFGTVVVDLKISPNNIYVKMEKGETKIKRQIELSNLSEEELHVLEVTTTSPAIMTNIKPTFIPFGIPAGKRFIIYLDIEPTDLEKKWKNLGLVRIKTDSKLNPETTVSIFISNPDAGM
jgi:hypothetical protein